MSYNFRVVVAFINRGEDLSFRIEDVNLVPRKRLGDLGPILNDHFMQYEEPLPSSRSVEGLRAKLREMLAACEKPVLFLYEHAPTLEEWKGRGE